MSEHTATFEGSFSEGADHLSRNEGIERDEHYEREENFHNL